MSDVSHCAPHFFARTVLTTDESATLQSAFELRYQVYCLELRFLDPAQYPSGREADEFDVKSAHFFSYNLRRELVGYVRLVPADASGQFPWQRHCLQTLPGVMLPPPAESAEISRLMVRHDYRRRRGDALSGVATQEPVPPRSGERRHETPQILLSLYRQMYQQCLKADLRYWYAAMERPLIRSLQRMDFNFRQMGPEIDYFGPVAPYMMDLRQMEADIELSNPLLLAWLQSPETNNG